jgi:methylmalonyl-CoA mutase N-terminal domain/subunit
MAAGLDVDEFAPRLSFFFNAHLDFFEEIGKYRAARRIWARWLKERYGAEDDRSLRLRFHAQTAGVSLTAQQPEVNIARVALQALSAVLGGTQSLHTDSYDEALALPSEAAARIALRTQQVIAHETGVTATPDPLGGSDYVEWMTDEMERRAEAIFAHLDELGQGSMLEGVLAGIDNGWIVNEIADAAYRYERQVNSGERIIVGVNRYTDGDDHTAELLRISADVEHAQVQRLEQVRRDRDQASVDTALSPIRRDAEDPTTHLLPALIDAVQARATEGEIVHALEAEFGTYVERAAV